MGSILSCDALGASQAQLPCNVIGSSDVAGDTLQGTSKGGAIVGGGGADIVTTNGGNEEVDLTSDTGATTVDCSSSSTYPTILYTQGSIVPSTSFAPDCAGASVVAE